MARSGLVYESFFYLFRLCTCVSVDFFWDGIVCIENLFKYLHDSGAYNKEHLDRTTEPLLCVSSFLNSSPSNVSTTVSFGKSVSVPVTGLSVACPLFPNQWHWCLTQIQLCCQWLLSVAVSRPTSCNATFTQSHICSTGMQLITWMLGCFVLKGHNFFSFIKL